MPTMIRWTARFADLAPISPDDPLVMADRMSMAHSLSCGPRSAITGHRGEPAHPAMDEDPRIPLKGLLKTAFADVLPPQVLSHRKQGFMIPLGRWLRADLRDLMEDLLAPGCLRSRGLFVPDAVEALKREHLCGARSHSDRLWTLMIAELWMRQYLDASGAWSLR
jgi:asparagine synthase (glutamine-hydrolysing)